MTEHVETVIVGVGQAGLDGNARVGDNWRQQWDMLRLYTYYRRSAACVG